MRLFATLAIIAALVFPAFAVEPDEVLDDPVLEERARGLSANLRCLVCQNQSIDDSNAELAKDLRVLVRERLVQGDSDTEVIDYVVSRYGEYVLLKPVMGAHTIALWFAAPLLLIGGFIAIVISMARRKRRPRALADELTPEENARLQALLKEQDG